MRNQFRSTAFVLSEILISAIHLAFGQSTTIALKEFLVETAIPEAIKGFTEPTKILVPLRTALN